MGDVVLGHLIDETPAAAERRQAATAPACEVFVVIADEARRPEALHIAQTARNLGWSTDFSLKAAKVGRQFQDAEALGARVAILVGAEWPMVKVKTLATRQEVAVNESELFAHLGKPAKN
jgi:histidyl-tRNA synthetase